MSSSRILTPLLCLLFIFSGCQKKDASSSLSSPNKSADKVTSMEFFSPARILTGIVQSDTPITDFKWLSAQINREQTIAPAAILPPPPVQATYYGNTRTYACGTDSWVYTFTWELFTSNSMITAMTPLGASLTLGSFSQTVTPVVVNTYTRMLNGFPIGTVVLFTFTVTGVPDDGNYCNTDSMTNAISFSYVQRIILNHTTTTHNAGSAVTESISPNTYVIFQYLVPSATNLGDGTYNIEVVPGILACGPCHESALGFSPTMWFYYHLVGSSSPWSSVATQTAGSTLPIFNVNVSQSGTYEYYTQGYTSPGVLSGQLYNGTIVVQ